MSESNKKEQFKYYNYLTGLARSLENKHTVIDLRNEATVTGLIAKVDGSMNVEMEDAVLYDQNGQEHKFKSFYIKSRSIRNVHVPNEFSMKQLIEDQLNDLNLSTKRQSVQKSTKHTNKRTKARRYQEETIQNAYCKLQPGPSNKT